MLRKIESFEGVGTMLRGRMMSEGRERNGKINTHLAGSGIAGRRERVGRRCMEDGGVHCIDERLINTKESERRERERAMRRCSLPKIQPLFIQKFLGPCAVRLPHLPGKKINGKQTIE